MKGYIKMPAITVGKSATISSATFCTDKNWRIYRIAAARIEPSCTEIVKVVALSSSTMPNIF